MSVDKTGDPCAENEEDCNKASSLVDKYLDNLLDENEELFIKRHLSGCPGCSHGFEFESSFHIRVKSLSPISMPPEVKESILLSLGFPGMADPMKGSFSAMGSPDLSVDPQISSQMGIPKGEIPQGEIPKSDFFRDDSDSSAT